MTEEMIERAVPRSRKGNHTQERLLQAAEQTFGELGYHDASVAEICRRAGVAHGTFYRYFAGKEEIFIRLIEGFGKRLRAQIDTAMEVAETPVDQLLVGYRSILGFIGRYVALYNV
ncbi:TetR/AcrR family transcriptional regulator, partial [Candidatus Acetothermia bacterium]